MNHMLFSIPSGLYLLWILLFSDGDLVFSSLVTQYESITQGLYWLRVLSSFFVSSCLKFRPFLKEDVTSGPCLKIMTDFLLFSSLKK